MKCPKCGYLGFEVADRCRNCGYDFSLTAAFEDPDLTIRSHDEAAGPLDDLALIDAATVVPTPALPLFAGDDTPLITTAAPPRPPLAVRRTPEPPRLRPAPQRTPMLDLAPLGADAEPHAPTPGQIEPAALPARLMAVLLDAVILAAVDAAIVYFTVQICGVTINDLRVLPRGPLAAFLLFQNLGYLVAFTAGGQTLGKMAAGIRVVPASDARSIDLGRSILRTAVWLILAIPAGLGFLSALLTADRRGLHDRLAGTRVVRASV